jgi:RNA polymerase sigma-70 factor (ECF subfamily)
VERALSLEANLTPALDAPDRSRRLGELFDGQQARLFRLARRMGADPAEAADLVQEAFLRLARGRRPIPEGTGGERWLVRTLVNLCRDRRRRLAVRAAGDRLLPPARRSDPQSEVALRDAVRDALGRLSPRRRAVVVLHEIEGMEVSEVAGLLGIARVTVRWHLSAGRRDLRRILGGRSHAEAGEGK